MKSSIIVASLCVHFISSIAPASAQPIFGGPPVFTDPGLQQCLEDAATEQGWTDTVQVARLTCPSRQIASTKGIEVLSSLTELDLTDNTLTDIAGLDLLTGLNELYLSGNEHIPLPTVQAVLANNSGLTRLGLADIEIGDLYKLPLFNGDPQVNAPYELVELDLSNTGITNIDRLVEFTDLTTLDLGNNC
jgi:Leucine-rich repeat (LRR) protein